MTKKLNGITIALAALFSGSAIADEPPTTAVIDHETGIAIREEWRKNNDPRGPYHRKNAPAFIARHCQSEGKYIDIVTKELWMEEDKLHRTDGPAVINRDCEGKIIFQEWLLNGVVQPQPKP